MSLFAGLDISVKTTAICVLDANGRVLLETMVDSAPEAIAGRLHEFSQPFERIGLEAGPLSQWIYAGLVDVGLAAICVETRHMHAALSARINKTDRNDARGIAQMMRVGLFKAVHVKTPASQHRRLLLTSRKLLQRKIYDIENDLRGSLRNFGLKVGVVGKIKFEDRIRELVADHSFVAAIVTPLLEARAALRAQFAKLHRMLLDLDRAPSGRMTQTGQFAGPRAENGPESSAVGTQYPCSEDKILYHITLNARDAKLASGPPYNPERNAQQGSGLGEFAVLPIVRRKILCTLDKFPVPTGSYVPCH